MKTIREFLNKRPELDVRSKNKDSPYHIGDFGNEIVMCNWGILLQQVKDLPQFKTWDRKKEYDWSQISYLALEMPTQASIILTLGSSL